MALVLVTGGRGFIGKNVAIRLIRSGHEVVGLGRGERAPIPGFARWVNCEIDLPNMLKIAKNVEQIYHCAGSAQVSISLRDPDVDFDSNVLTTRAILEFARNSPATKVVVLSSASVYGAVDKMPISIKARCSPVSPYGFNKCISELLVMQYSRFFQASVSIVRLFSVYGEGLRKQLLWDACSKLSRGEANFFGSGNEVRDWIHIDDASRLIIEAAAAAGPEVKILNGGVGAPVAIKEVVLGLASRMGYTGPISFDGIVRKGDPDYYHADISEALMLGWSPRISLHDGLDRYVSWFLDEVSLRNQRRSSV